MLTDPRVVRFDGTPVVLSTSSYIVIAIAVISGDNYALIEVRFCRISQVDILEQYVGNALLFLFRNSKLNSGNLLARLVHSCMHETRRRKSVYCGTIEKISKKIMAS